MAPIKRSKKLYEIVIDEIKVLIDAEDLKVGDKLPTERELGNIFSVSRTCVREALSALQNEGHLEIIQGKGIFIKNKNAFLLPDIAQNNEHLLDQFQEAREALEAEIAFWAAQRASKEDLKMMKQALDDMENESRKDSRERLQADYDFHSCVARASGNDVLIDMLRQVNDYLHKGRSATLAFPKSKEKALKGHRNILNAIIEKNPDRARLEMKKHLQDILQAQKYMTVLEEKRN